MIQTFAENETEQLFNREPVKRFPPSIRRPGLRNYCFSMLRNRWTTYVFHPVIVLKNSAEIERASTVFGSTINGVFVFAGRPATPTRSRLLTIIEAHSCHDENQPRSIQARILLEEFLAPLGISQYRLAKDISVSPRRINEIVRGQRSITADTALRLARFFRMTDRFWLNLQVRYDLELEKDRLGDRLDREVTMLPVQN